MLSIRMTRVGSKKKPFFRVVVTEARSALQSSFVENLGHLQPALEAGEGRDQQGARAALAEEGRAAVGLGAHAAREAPDARSVGAGRRRPRHSKSADAATAGRRQASPLRAVVEVVVRALVDQPDAVQGHRDASAAA